MTTRGCLGVLVLACGCHKAPIPVQMASSELVPLHDVPSLLYERLRPPGEDLRLDAPAVAWAAAHATADVGTTVRAQVVRVYVQPGATVAVNDAVLDIAAPDLVAAASTYLGANERLRVHEQRIAALAGFKREGFVGGGDLFAQEAAAADLRAQRDGAAATLRVAGLEPARASAIVRSGEVTLRAPVAGVVATLHARLGEIRDGGGEPFARIVGVGEVTIEVRTPQALGQGAELVFASADGQTMALDPTPHASVVDAATGTHVTWFKPRDAATKVAHGLRGTVRMTAPAGTWVLPVTAIARRGANTFVQRRRGNDVAQIQVDVVTASAARVFVRAHQADALQAGDEVARNASDENVHD